MVLKGAGARCGSSTVPRDPSTTAVYRFLARPSTVMSASVHDAQPEKEVPELTAAAPAPVKRTRIEIMSSYFTIAAAAAGLISDGCMYSYRKVMASELICLQTRTTS